MKRGGVSTLNPYAAAYIPLSKRGVENETADVAKAEVWMRKKEDEVGVDEEFEMDVDYIQMAFPAVSHDSIRDLYIANHADLEATIDMLTQLEFDSLECSENLPDSLDIWDVSEPGSSSAECSSVKLKNVAGEVSTAASDSTASGKVVIA